MYLVQYVIQQRERERERLPFLVQGGEREEEERAATMDGQQISGEEGKGREGRILKV